MARGKPQKAGKSERKTRYRAKEHYGTRGAEQNKQVIQFGRAKATIYRRGDIENSSWYFRTYLREEGRHYRKSLQTSDRGEAIEKAEQEILAILSQVKSGSKIFSPSVRSLFRDYSDHLEALVESGQTARSTAKLHRYRIELGKRFISAAIPAGLETKLSAFDGAVFGGYLTWRQADAAKNGRTKRIRRDVVRDELLTIRKVFLLGVKRAVCQETAVPKWEFVVEKQGASRRRMTQRDYTDVMNIVRDWVDTAESERDIYYRRMVQAVLLVMSNCGLRSGEVFGLRNQSIEVREKAGECVIDVRPETSKVRKGRKITLGASTGGRTRGATKVNYLIRWIKRDQRFHDRGDFVFSSFESGSRRSRDSYYRTYKQLRERLAEAKLEWFDPYHCRHFWITNRLMADEPIHLVAKAAGTSTNEIEATYSHVLTELATRRFGKKQVKYNSDGSWDIVAG